MEQLIYYFGRDKAKNIAHCTSFFSFYFLRLATGGGPGAGAGPGADAGRSYAGRSYAGGSSAGKSSAGGTLKDLSNCYPEKPCQKIMSNRPQ